ncbi:hypothetical protein FIE12Z_5152 [Fusarium flagelliforme]|uniref:Uncharacterized protein n=1 Tax=Fusarium flagelliforme TaxID=2675880 RepID=A0A395MSB6_9HYPO|nr:hypothetical protein FIE12Z_5152 [Fusarium flagelliforme]
MTTIWEDKLDRLGNLMEVASPQFTKSRASVLEPAYDAYLNARNLRDRAPPPSLLHILPSVDISIKLSRCKKTTKTIDLEITRNSDALDDNFMGYCKDQKCVVFKGEGGLVDKFIDVIESAAGKTQIDNTTFVLKAPSKIRIPFGGLEYGLKYEEFVNRVEVLQCAVWIRNSPSEQVEGGERFVNVANASRTPPPSTPEYTPMSPDAQLAHRADSEYQSPPAQDMDTNSPLSSCGSSLPPPTPMDQDDTESNSDTSSLSPPPSVIHTPPWLRSDDEDDSDYNDDA